MKGPYGEDEGPQGVQRRDTERPDHVTAQGSVAGRREPRDYGVLTGYTPQPRDPTSAHDHQVVHCEGYRGVMRVPSAQHRHAPRLPAERRTIPQARKKICRNNNVDDDGPCRDPRPLGYSRCVNTDCKRRTPQDQHHCTAGFVQARVKRGLYPPSDAQSQYHLAHPHGSGRQSRQ
eukprot:TRINITY_DN20439_c0_g1_i1.p2 TRINITY_DN20439_c0_g1~~TRINITY_DN20439_c0_g1_i1.p2  ORF type:complete len:175 (-),score=3.08 TRINITY_DN20439_c0_g1_i1:550-1074(-)